MLALLSMLTLADIPVNDYGRVTCSITSAIKYEVPVNIMLAVAEQEGGTPGEKRINRNGTYDVGAMQFNTRYLQDLARHGITQEHVEAEGCYAYELAAWRIRMHLKNDRGDIWTRVANYHSRTPQHNLRYRLSIMDKASKWADWLERRVNATGIHESNALQQ